MKGRSASTHKKVVVRKLDKETVKGYVNPAAFLGPGDAQLLDLNGHLLKISLNQIKGIYFVREFEGNEEREERKIFLSRPKLSGLWVRMTFTDREVLDGILPENLMDLLPQGFFITPPDVYSNNLKIFVPKAALASLEVLGVISNGAHRARSGASAHRRPARVPSAQLRLFPSSGSTQVS